MAEIRYSEPAEVSESGGVTESTVTTVRIEEATPEMVGELVRRFESEGNEVSLTMKIKAVK